MSGNISNTGNTPGGSKIGGTSGSSGSSSGTPSTSNGVQGNKSTSGTPASAPSSSTPIISQQGAAAAAALASAQIKQVPKFNLDPSQLHSSTLDGVSEAYHTAKINDVVAKTFPQGVDGHQVLAKALAPQAPA